MLKTSKTIALLAVVGLSSFAVGAMADCYVKTPYDTMLIKGGVIGPNGGCSVPTPPPTSSSASSSSAPAIVWVSGQNCDYVKGPYGNITLPACPKK